MQNPEKKYRVTYLQSRNRKNRHRKPTYEYQDGKRRWDELGDWD